METWRKFINEVSFASRTAYGKKPEQPISPGFAQKTRYGKRRPAFDPEKDAMAVYTGWQGWDMYIVLYHPQSHSGANEQVFAMMALTKAGRNNPATPCIPNTYSVRLAAVDKAHQGLGLGKKLYQLAGTAVKDKFGKDAGLTSDHSSGGSSSKQAQGVWSKIQSMGFYKRSTNQGNDEFDYTGQQTPQDKEDDCVKPAGSVGTKHSWGLRNNHPEYSKLVGNWENHPPAIGEKGLRKQATALFDKEYKGRAL